MKYLTEFRNEEAVKHTAGAIKALVTKPWKVMEVCGGQTHSIVRYGIDQLLPPEVTLIHGPGCPVCVTPIDLIDRAIEISKLSGVILCSFGDMLRVPGSSENLLSAKAQGADIRTVYSPMDALTVACDNPDKQVVFFAVGFETTAPTTAAPVHAAKRRGVKNFSLLASHVLVPPAVAAILSAADCQVQGFLAPGHVCTITGTEDYERLSEKYKVPFVITGFEPLDILQGLFLCLKQLEEGRHEVENEYARSVRRSGNTAAKQILEEVFTVSPRKWRGIGEIPQSGLELNDAYREFDARCRFPTQLGAVQEPEECQSGLILTGLKKPHECVHFGKRCTPEHPLGATMVSSEGACAAYYRYRGPCGE